MAKTKQSLERKERRRLPAHAQLFDWKTGGPYKWKDNFPLKPILKPRRLGRGSKSLPGPSEDA